MKVDRDFFDKHPECEFYTRQALPGEFPLLELEPVLVRRHGDILAKQTILVPIDLDPQPQENPEAQKVMLMIWEMMLALPLHPCVQGVPS